MDARELEQAVKVAELSAAVESYKADLAVLHHVHGPPRPSVRETTYKGHRIRVVTTYEISVDGKPVTGHLMISNEGTVHYHAIPNQEFVSMVDMVKRIVDLAWDLGSTPPSTGDEHDGHAHGHDHAPQGHDHAHGEGV
jgi:hypothetical protein